MKYLVTGCAGFIGSHVSLALLDRGEEVVGLDDLNPYYDVTLKQARLARLEGLRGFSVVKAGVEDKAAVDETFVKRGPFDHVIHLAAQAGVRYSLTHPQAYVDANITGFLNILEGCRHSNVSHLTYASSSSVYGANTKSPFAETDPTDHPVSLYAASKRANELMAHTYSHLFSVPTTGLRFFTVYGPWGRPDMALFLFTRAILAGEPIKVFNAGKMRRDFSYVDDIVSGVLKASDRVPAPGAMPVPPNPASAAAPYRVYNLAGRGSVELTHLIDVLEDALGKKAEREMLPMQPGDVPETAADLTLAERDLGYDPKTRVEEGVPRFVRWYRDYFRV
ncbi:MAG: NAD-dependent epimerase [Planctomycetota bacterium]|nr:NAD-dependent epimerase [Planctomycetaceae bacterium]MDQ3332887.1 NAD-dependent epimerase [Planctomycetota bacterium]